VGQRDRPSVRVGAASFDDFVRDHQEALVRYAALLCQSRALAEDLVQEVLVRVYLRWEALTSADGSLYAYARRGVTNEYLSWRRRWSTRHIHLAEAGQLEQEPVDPWQTGDDQLWECLGRLPKQQRAAVVLRFYEGLTDAEIGEAMGCREGTVRGHVSRGLANLRSAIATPTGARRTHHG
jgi:RNA polymerase sigma-70 factor (sigma-E family)